VAVESDVSSAEMADIAAAKIAAISSPVTPTGSCVVYGRSGIT
jgi:hypothetical protein